MENSNKKTRVFLAQISLSVSVVLFFIKYWAYQLTSSQAILSDTMENVVNIVAAGLALWVIYWAAQPADREHPYGHGKAELLSAAFEGGLIFAAALMIMASSLQALFESRPLEKLGVGIFITVGAAIINGALGYLLRWRGREIQSPALEASGEHLISDLITSVGIVVGLIFVMWTGYIWIDSVLAILVALHLLVVGYKIIKKSLQGLLDGENIEFIKKFNKIINNFRPEGIIQLHHVRMILSGNYHHVDAHVVIPEYWDVKRAHDVTTNYEKQVFGQYGHEGEIHFHIDPCMRRYCQYCNEEECPIRKEPYEAPRSISLEEMIDAEEPFDKKN